MNTFAALLVSAGLSLPTQTECLAGAIYHEARGESLEGQTAVALVVKNRVLSEEWPNDICRVLEQPHQFSYMSGDTTMYDKDVREDAYSVAQEVLESPARVGKGGAVFFHSTSVRPPWDYSKLQEGDTIGNHKFWSLRGHQ